GNVRGIVFKVVPDPTVQALELSENVCDLSENYIPPDLVRYLGARSALNVATWPGTSFRYLAFNFQNPILRDLRVRAAIAYAIDRRQIVDSYLRGTARVATGMLSPENWAYEQFVLTYRYDPDHARQLLDAAGFHADARGMRNLTLTYKTTPEEARMA